jgi:hypothetical protein
MARTTALGSRYLWDDRLRQYVDPSTKPARMVSRRAVREELDKTLDATKERARGIARQLREGRITAAEFRREMAVVVKDVNCIGAAAAKGGWAQMSQSDWGRVGPRVKEQLQFLNAFTQDVVDGKVRLDGRFESRAAQYANTGRASYEKTARREFVSRGYDQARRILGAADHCPGCVLQDSLGWVDINDVAEIGSQECRHNCKCHIEYRHSGTADVATIR